MKSIEQQKQQQQHKLKLKVIYNIHWCDLNGDLNNLQLRTVPIFLHVSLIQCVCIRSREGRFKQKSLFICFNLSGKIGRPRGLFASQALNYSEISGCLWEVRCASHCGWNFIEKKRKRACCGRCYDLPLHIVIISWHYRQVILCILNCNGVQLPTLNN